MDTFGLAIVFVILVAICVSLSYLWQLECDRNQVLTGIIDAALREFVSGKPIGDNLRKTLPGVVATMSDNLRAASEEIDRQKATVATQKEVIQKLERMNAERTVYGDRLHAQTVELRKELAEAKALLDKANADINERDAKIAELRECEKVSVGINSELIDAASDRDRKIAELMNEVDRLKSEIKSNLDAKRPKPWKNFLSNLIEAK